jgi:sorbitol-specific phosphotransferase system component IIC
MHWQDWVLTGGQITFSFALLPTILQEEKPAISTSIINGIVLIGIAIVNVSVSFYIAAVMTLLTGSLWFTLAIQAILKKH